ncbi:MAG TPA: hypothetical protein VJ984_06650 [Xanthomonadales bacterium]|nr:hypothetical protein [Xanthomonadales bacterium]
MGRECQYSFDDLFRLANERDWTAAEKNDFMLLDQDARNQEVKRLAGMAGGVRTEDRLGTDGLTYTAFWVEKTK